MKFDEAFQKLGENGAFVFSASCSVALISATDPNSGVVVITRMTKPFDGKNGVAERFSEATEAEFLASDWAYFAAGGEEKECCGGCNIAESKYPPISVEKTDDGANVKLTGVDWEAAFHKLAQELADRDAMITGLIMKAGGRVVLSQDEVKAIHGNTWAFDPSDDESFIFTSGPAPVDEAKG